MIKTLRTTATELLYDGPFHLGEQNSKAYEYKALRVMQSINKKHLFLDRDGLDFYVPDTNDYEDWRDYFESISMFCKRVVRYKNLTHFEEKFLLSIGLGMINEDFNYELGEFQYSWENSKWEKLDE